MTAGAIAFDPWAALGTGAQPRAERAPNPPNQPQSPDGVGARLGKLGGLGGAPCPERATTPEGPDHNAAEAAALAAHYTAPGNADAWRPEVTDLLRDGLLASALLARPPSCVDPAPPLPRSAPCSRCCSRRRSGGLWGRHATTPNGWRCKRDHSADHAAAKRVAAEARPHLAEDR